MTDAVTGQQQNKNLGLDGQQIGVPPGAVLRVRVHEAKGAVLNWLVAKCEGVEDRFGPLDGTCPAEFAYASTPQLAAQIAERECITWHRWVPWPVERWWATKYADGVVAVSKRWGSTKEEAAMRCYVDAKLGDESLVPQMLVLNARRLAQAASSQTAAPDDGLRNVLHHPPALPFYIWANEDCSYKAKSWALAKDARLSLINGGGEAVYICDADGVEVVDAEVAAHEALLHAGYAAGPSGGRVDSSGSTGRFAVYNTPDGNGFILTGDDLAELMATACERLQLEVEVISREERAAGHSGRERPAGS